MDKLINTTCVCKKRLEYNNNKIIILDPCEHIIHKICLHKKNICPICSIKIIKKYSKKQLKKKIKKKRITSIEYQKYVDMIAVSNFNNLYVNNTDNISFNLIELFGIISKIPISSGYDDGYNLCKEILNLLNTKLIVNGYENFNKIKDKPKVIIANHTTHIDYVIILYLFRCGFLSSNTINKHWIGKLVLNLVPMMVINRGNTRINTVDKIKKFIEKNKSICIFPEGMITHPDTICKFRTGSFYTGYPVCPIVINYEPVIYHYNTNMFIKKLVTGPNLKIKVNILPPEYPPFNNVKIEEIRKKMAKSGNLALSRVSNRDIKK
jgi:1-acyl-sn-glycerol-3-phosphate acyltransferase